MNTIIWKSLFVVASGFRGWVLPGVILGVLFGYGKSQTAQVIIASCIALTLFIVDFMVSKIEDEEKAERGKAMLEQMAAEIQEKIDESTK